MMGFRRGDDPKPHDPSQFFTDYVPEQDAEGKPNGADADGWAAPDMSVLRTRRRPPPIFPLDTLGDAWGCWVADAAAAASCPVDYVVAPLLAAASALVGHARWAQATPGWTEPPHMWIVTVGDSGDGKSPGSDCLLRDVLPTLEKRMIGDFPEKLREWRASAEFDKAAEKHWQESVREAEKQGKGVLHPPRRTVSDIEPQSPRLRQNDVTIEQVAAVLSASAPKGLLVIRDEIAGWLLGMNSYNAAGRAFWIEAYGGRPYRVERRKHSTSPIEIARLAVAVSGGTQPERLEKLVDGADDGLLARIQWVWPEPVPFELRRQTPNIDWAIAALDRLRELDLCLDDPPGPILMSLTAEGQKLMQEFGLDMQERRAYSGGLLRSAYGKARGTALRLSLVLEWLWWSGQDGVAALMPPSEISTMAFKAAAAIVGEYFLPMAERVFGDAGATPNERIAATLAKWIVKERPAEVHVRHLQREVRLPGLRTAAQIKDAAEVLIEADWLRAPPKGTTFGQRVTVSYAINPKVYRG
jgi:hypothetical protein